MRGNHRPNLATLLGMVLILAVGLSSAAASPSVRESTAPASHVPLLGDRGLYEVQQVRTTAKETTAVEGNVLLRWDAEDIPLAGGDLANVPSLRASAIGDGPSASTQPSTGHEIQLLPDLLLNPGKDYSAEDPLHIQDYVVHLDALPGEPRARTIVWNEITKDVKHPRVQWSQRTQITDACAPPTPEAVVAILSGRAESDALDRLQACGAHASLTNGLWHVTAAGVDIRVRMDPRWSLPSSMESQARQGALSLQTKATLVGFQRGDSRLPTVTFPGLPAPLQLVDWTWRGPSRGDLLEHPFVDSQAALEKDDADARTFFREHRDARVLFATHAWVSPDASPLPKADPWTGRIKGVRCDPAESPAQGQGAGEWTTSWVANNASIFTVTNRQPMHALLPSTAAAAAERVVVVDTDDYGIANSGIPALRAPAPQELAERLHDVDLLQTTGQYSIDFAFVPTAAGNIMGAASVSRGVCSIDPSSGVITYAGTSIWFIEGRPTSVVVTSIQRNEPALLPISIQSSDRLPAGRSSLPALPLIAGAAMIAGGVAAPIVPRLLSAAYTRLAKAKLLSNPVRAALMAAIRERPGAVLNELSRALGAPRNTLEYHAKILHRHGLLVRARAPRGWRYFAPGAATPARASALDRAHAREVMAAVIRPSNLTAPNQETLAARVGIATTHLSPLVRALEAEGLVQRRRQGRSVLILPGPNAPGSQMSRGR